MKVLIIGIFHREGIKMLEEAGIEVKIVPYEKWNDETALIREVREVDAIIVGRSPITRKIIESAPKLKVIARHGQGVENIDLDAATERGILVIDVGDSNAQAVAEHTLCLIMALAKQVVRANSVVKAGGWMREFSDDFSRPVIEISGKTLGIVGFGRIGKKVAKMAQAIGMRVLVYDPYLASHEIKKFGAEPAECLEKLLAESDFVSLHVPLVEETFHLIREKELNIMKTTAFLINTCRGGVVDELALIKALTEKKIAGAGLDVLETEPPNQDNPLLKMENVVLTPHSAWFTEEAFWRMGVTLARNIIAVLKNEIPENVVNKQVLFKIKKHS